MVVKHDDTNNKPRLQRSPQPGPEWRDDPALPLHRQPPTIGSLRHDFANLVIRQLTAPGARVAVIDDNGKPAVVRCNELLYDLLSKDHPIVGIYTPGARVRDVIDDLKAAGL